MKGLTLIPIVTLSLFTFFCSSNKNKIKSEVDFANRLAGAGLWKEAYFRWQKCLDRGMNTALIHNNIAVALEKMGKYKEAEKEYRKALKLAPRNTYIQDNHKRLKKILERRQDETENNK